jgi:hypothetical protein
MRSRGLRRHQHDAQFRHLDPSFTPGQADARKPESLASEGQAQEQSVNQQ